MTCAGWVLSESQLVGSTYLLAGFLLLIYHTLLLIDFVINLVFYAAPFGIIVFGWNQTEIY